MASIELSLQVSRVSIYTDGAQVTRAGTIRLEAGKHVVTVPGLPRYTDEESVRVSGTGPGSILNVVVKPAFFEKEPSARARDLVAGKHRLNKEIDRKKENLDRNQLLVEQLAEASDHVGHGFAVYAAAGKAGVPALVETATALATRAEALVDEGAVLEKDIVDLEKQLRACELELSKLDTIAGTVERKEARVDIDASSGGDFRIELSYMFTQAKARWKPAYEINVGEKSGDATMKVEAMVLNNTGEDWDDISLVLSTASTRPVSTREPSPYFLRARKIEAAATGGGLGKSMRRSPSGGGMPVEVDEAEAEMDDADDRLADMELASAGVEVRAGIRSYRIQGAVSIPAGKETGPFFLEQFTLKSRVELFWSSARESLVVARNQVVNGSAVLLPGRIKTYIDGEYAGESDLATTRPGETFKTGVRESKIVKVKKQLLDRGKKKAGAFVKDKVSRTYKHRVSLTFMDDVDTVMEVVDTVPFTDSTRIVVEDVVFSIPPDKNEIGVVRWKVPTKGKKDWAVEYEFTVRHPAGLDIVPPLP